MFISLFNTLKATGVPCSLRELLDLIAAVDKRLAFANMNEFYFLSRAPASSFQCSMLPPGLVISYGAIVASPTKIIL